MERKVTVIYTGFSVLAFVALISWSAYSIFQTKASNTVNAANTFVDVQNSVAVTRSGKGRNTPKIQRYVHSLFLEDPAIDVLVIKSSTDEVLYIYARHSSSLSVPRVAGNRFIG